MTFRFGFGFCTRILVLTVSVVAPLLALAQESGAPSLRAGSGAETVNLDGNLNEAAWRAAPISDALVQVEPLEGGVPSV